jgi:hypothetical protein
MFEDEPQASMSAGGPSPANPAPVFGFVALITFRVLDPSVGLYAAAAAAVFLVDAMLWRVAARLFNRERLLTARATAR